MHFWTVRYMNDSNRRFPAQDDWFGTAGPICLDTLVGRLRQSTGVDLRE